jgi:ubiquilin
MMDPNNWRSMIQMRQAMQQLSGNVPGFPALGANPYAPPPSAGGLDFSSLLGTGGVTGGTAPSPFMFPFMPPVAGGVTGAGTAASIIGGSRSVAQPAAPGQRFRMQLQSLHDMGFTDRSANIRALTSTSGNVNRAIEVLLENPPEMANSSDDVVAADDTGDGVADTVNSADSGGAEESSSPKDSSEKKND